MRPSRRAPLRARGSAPTPVSASSGRAPALPDLAGVSVEHVTRRIGLWTAWLALLFSVVPVPLAAQPQAGPAAPHGRVAVLPFQVNSAKPLGYLESSLADLLMSRLEASGQVEVLESQAVRDKTVA